MKILRRARENGRLLPSVHEERKWRKLFENPSAWRDNRRTKCNATYPDFVHALTGDKLWISSQFAPGWIREKLRSLDVRSQPRGDERVLEALSVYERVRESGSKPTVFCFVAALRACKVSKDWERGRGIHAHADETGTSSDASVANALLEMYTRCGRMVEAQQVFDKMVLQDVQTWTCLISGYVFNGQSFMALKAFQRMSDQGCVPDGRTFLMALKACSSLVAKEERKHYEQRAWLSMCLEKGSAIHSQLEKAGCEMDVYVGSALVDMYAKCGSMRKAQQVFDEMKLHDNIVAWTSLILGYAQSGEAELALRLFQRMQDRGVTPTAQTFVAAVKSCTEVLKQGDERTRKTVLEKATAIRSQVEERGFETNVIVASSLVDMYSKCGRMLEARKIFERMPQRDAVSWNTIIMGCAQCGEEDMALELYSHMQDEGFKPNARTFIAALYACSGLAAKEEPRPVDGNMLKVSSLEKGLAIHQQLRNSGHELEIYVASTLVDMYSKCGSLVDARQVFDRMPHHDVISWTAIIMGYAQAGYGELALEYFRRMEDEGFVPEARAFVAGLKACSCEAVKEDKQDLRELYLEKGRLLHRQLVESGYEEDKFVASSLVDMYSKCGSMQEARLVFRRMKHRDVVAWNAVIMGSVQNGESEIALELISQMQTQGFALNSVTFVGALKACGQLVAVEDGKRFHHIIRLSGLERETLVANSLIGFYSRVGHMTSAQQVFDMVESKDSVTWTALMTGYSNQGDTMQVFDLFESMQNERLEPDPITFLALLTACGHAGLVEKGKEYFQAMCSDYVMRPSVEHYTCMIDLLSRANHLEEAVTMARSMPYEPTSQVWMTVLSACRKWKNVTVGKLAFDSLLKLNCVTSSAYVLMANLYTGAGMLKESEKLQESCS